MANERKTKTRQRALVICAHDDDEVIGPGGTIRRLANAGVEVTTVVFGVGNEGYPTLAQRRTIVRDRVRERKAAQKILGTARCIAHGFRDFENLDCERVYRKVMQAVRAVRPHIVFTHLAADYLAHRTLATVVPEAVWQAGWVCSLELGEPWEVNAIFHFPIIELLGKPSHIVDITDTLETKIKAMKAYRSQHTVVRGILDQIEAKARAYGSLAGFRYGEAFVRCQSIPLRVPDPLTLLA